jgi:ABC-type multidrug transport system fused ATPase/permease subunit
MLEIVRKLNELLTPQERRRAIYVLLLLLAVAVFETAGVASIIPFIAVLSNPDAIAGNEYLNFAYEFFNFESEQQFLFWLGVGVLTMLLVSLSFRALGHWTQLRFTQARNHALASRVVKTYLSQPFTWFLDRHSADAGNAVLAEVTQVVNDALFPLMQMVAQTFVAVALLTLLFVIDPILAIVIAGVLGGAYAGLFTSVRSYLGRIGEERRVQNLARFRSVQEAFGGIKDVKIAGLENVLLARFMDPSSRLVSIHTSQGVIAQIPSFAMQGILYGGMMLVLLYLLSTHGNFQQALPVIAVYAFAGYRLMPTLQSLYASLTRLRFAVPVLNSLYEDLSKLQDLEIAEDEPAPMPFRKQLELDQISFTYPNAGSQALQKLSLTVGVHQTIGLVGSTGAGKTTAVDLILGLLRPDSGEMRVDGVPINESNVRSWQRALGYVPQQIYLTDSSVASNIAFGMPESQIDMAAVERAAKTANLHEFVMNELENGYETEVGERGIRLSGGQRQRIGIARALYHDPEIVIMDEATSALDNLTERAVMDAVHELSRKKTLILIAHRLSTVRACDRIYLLDGGNTVDEGTYDDLVANSSQFRAMAVVGQD